MIRTRKFVLCIPDGSDLVWKTINEMIRPAFAAATELSNHCIRSLFVQDAPVFYDDDDGIRKLQPFDPSIEAVLMQECQAIYPALNTRSISYVVRNTVKNWKKERFKVLAMHDANLRSFRWPQPWPIGDVWQLHAREEDGKTRYYVSFTVNPDPRRKAAKSFPHTRYELSLCLVAGWKDRDILDRILSGEYKPGQARLMKSRGMLPDGNRVSKLVIELGWSFEPTPITDRIDPSRELEVVCSTPPKLLEITWPNCDQSKVIAGTDYVARRATLDRRNLSMRSDCARELLSGCNKARQRRRRIEARERGQWNMGNWMLSYTHYLSRVIVRMAGQLGCGTIVFRYENAGDFQWSRLEVQTKSKADELGIVVNPGCCEPESVEEVASG